MSESPSLVASREELQVLIEKARSYIERLSSVERNSLYAVQGLGWAVSELVMTIFEENADPKEVRAKIGALRVKIEHKIPFGVSLAERLTESDRLLVLSKIDDALVQVDAEIAKAA
jgi:hypothetical protein